MSAFQGRTAMVTGAARGIGAGIAAGLLERGANVVLFDSDAGALSASVDSLSGHAGRAHPVAGDITDVESVGKAVSTATERYGAVDILVNNAGIIRDNRVEKITDQDWDDVLSVNLKGAFFACRAVVPGMRKRGYGKIVNIASRAWLGNFGQANYSASKGGLVSLTRTLALELARDQINVNAVAPGLIDTDMVRSLSPEVRERLVRMQPTRRMGAIGDIVAAVCFLASDDAGFITGQILHVDGGKSCGLLSL
jgi:3-oxoacyl-[acyl-carrier protein] reductase